MGDQAQYSDDISALWGPDDTGVWDAAPRRRDEPALPSLPRPAGRVETLEAHLHVLADAVETLRGEVLARVDVALAGSERRIAEASSELTQRLAALEHDVRDGLTRLAAFLDANASADGAHAAPPYEAEAEARLHRRLDELAAQAAVPQPPPHVDERLGALECRTALLAESIEAYRREAVREPHLDAIRADLQAAADDIAARTDDHLTRRFHELAGHLSHTTSSQLAAFGQRILRLDDLFRSYRVQSVMGWELESLRSELIEAVRAELAELRAELRAELHAELAAADAHGTNGGNATNGGNGSEAEAERRRLEASWQQSMPGF